MAKNKVKLFFHDFDKNGNVLHQACVLSKYGSGRFEVQYFSWFSGHATDIVYRSLPHDGVFYKTSKDMRLGYIDLIREGKTYIPEDEREQTARDCEAEERVHAHKKYTYNDLIREGIINDSIMEISNKKREPFKFIQIGEIPLK